LGVPAVTVMNPATISGASHARVAAQPEASESSSSQETQALQIPEGGTIAILRGLASNGLPFQERDLILPVGERDATMLIGPMVGLGSKLQVIFSKNCVEDAVVTATSHSREYDRWRIWLNFSRVLLVAKS
jgi:hypothetical protein